MAEYAGMSIFAPPADTSVPALQGVTFAPRALAQLIDMGVHYTVAAASGFVFGVLVVLAAAIRHVPFQPLLEKATRNGAIAFIAAMLGSVFVHALCEGLYGATLGKRLLGMTVISEDLTFCSFPQAVKRSFAFIIDGLFFGAVAWSNMKDSPQHQRLGDKWAETIVVRRADVPPALLHSTGRFFAILLLAFVADFSFLALGMTVNML
jgi:uncharacterized RDD family membrane protein YckC